jgi:hypothetical protein
MGDHVPTRETRREQDPGAPLRGKGREVPSIPLRDPGFLQGGALTMPALLGLLFLVAGGFKPTLPFAVIVWPPFGAWSLAVYIWAGRRAPGKAVHVEARVHLDTTILGLLYAQIGTVLGSSAFLFVALAVLTAGGAVGSIQYTAIIVLYLLAFAASFVLPGALMRAEVDAGDREPQTRGGRLLRRASTIAVGRGALAGLGLAMAVLARAVLSEAWFSAVVGALALVPAFGLILLTMTGFRKWQYLRRLRVAEFGDRDQDS